MIESPAIYNYTEIPTTSFRFTGDSQTSEGWTIISSPKKRKFNTIGRPTGSINRTKIITPDAQT